MRYSRLAIMKKFIPVMAVLALLCLTVASAFAYVETFGSNNASWKYGYGTGFTEVAATWNATGGNPTGHISGVSSNLYAVWTFATAPYVNLTGLMTIDTKITDGETGNAQFYVGRGGTYYIGGSWAIGADTTWTTHTVALNTSNFTRWTLGGAGTQSLAYVLAAPDDIGIFFGGGVAGGTGNVLVDNFGTAVNVLSLVPTAESIYVQYGEEVIVDLKQASLSQAVAGYQAFLSFDGLMLSIGEPDITFMSPPYGRIQYADVNGATIDVADGVPDGGPLATSNATVARLEFTALSKPGITQVVFRTNDPVTQFTDNLGNPVAPTTVNSVNICVDNTPPSITCPANVSVGTDAGVCHRDKANVTLGTPNTADPGGSGVASVTNNAPDPFLKGDTMVTWTVTDNAGNSNSCQQKVTINDTQAPVVTSGSIASCYATQALAEAAALAATAATDNCPGALTKTASTTGTCTATIKVTVKDEALNSAYVEYSTRIDNTPPAMTCPGDIAVYAAPGSSSAVVTWACSATDICDGARPVTCNPPSGSTFTVAGSPHTVTCSATDTCGNTGTCQFTVTVMNKNQATMTVELLGVTSAPTRNIEFQFGGTGGGNNSTVVAAVAFNAEGIGTVTLEIPAGVSWNCVSAKDIQHTLRRKGGLTVSGTIYTGSLALIGGNANNDDWIDILDFGAFVGQYNQAARPYPQKDADFDCSGWVGPGSADFSFLQIGFLTRGDALCGGASVASMSVASVNQPRSSISVRELARIIGERDAKDADLNKDGTVNLTDIKLFMQGHTKRGR